MSNRYLICMLATCVVCFSFAGCRNRCQPYGYPYQQPYLNQYGYNAPVGQQFPLVTNRSGLIAPPATGTINIPSIARNNPFGANRGLLNTGQPAPTPANRSAQFNRENGWQPAGNGAAPAANPPNQSRPQSNTGTTLGSTSNPTTQPGATTPAGARRSPDYATTQVNESFDRTRLPATDASGMTAPSQYYARATGARVAQLPAQGVFAAAPQPYYSGTFQGNGAIVQAQSTASYDPYGNTRSADWRNRDISSGTFQ